MKTKNNDIQHNYHYVAVNKESDIIINMYICEKGVRNENEDRCTIDCFFSGIPHSTIFSALKYASQLPYLA